MEKFSGIFLLPLDTCQCPVPEIQPCSAANPNSSRALQIYTYLEMRLEFEIFRLFYLLLVIYLHGCKTCIYILDSRDNEVSVAGSSAFVYALKELWVLCHWLKVTWSCLVLQVLCIIWTFPRFKRGGETLDPMSTGILTETQWLLAAQTCFVLVRVQNCEAVWSAGDCQDCLQLKRRENTLFCRMFGLNNTVQ